MGQTVQANRAISGTVTDSSGAAIVGATVTVTNTATGGTRNTTTTRKDCMPSRPASRLLSTQSRLQGSRLQMIRSFKVDVQNGAMDAPLQVGALARR
jgi:hypothetical protein